MITEIRLYWENNPLFSSQGNNFTLGTIDDTGVLTHISNTDSLLNIQIIEPVSGQLINNNSTIIVTPDSENNITLRMTLIYDGFIQYVSYVLVPPIVKMTANTLYSNLINLLPKNVYTQSISAPSSIKQLAIANTLYQLYDNSGIENPSFTDLSTILKNIYPNSGNPNWEIFLLGSNRLLYQDSTQYGALLELIYQCEINNNNNPYWLAYNISKFIYLWLGISKYVYVGEGVLSNLTNGFILNNNKLGGSFLIGNNNNNNKLVAYYILTTPAESVLDLYSGGYLDCYGEHNNFPILLYGSGPVQADITVEQQGQINLFVRQITRAGMGVSVDYTQSASDLGLDIDLHDTYWKDPRQNKRYCIEYNQGQLDQALGLTSDAIQNYSIDSFTITLQYPDMSTQVFSDGDTMNLIAGQSYTVISVDTNPAISSLNPQAFTQYFSSESPGQNSDILSFSFDGINEHINAVGSSVSIPLRIYLFNITFTLNVVVVDGGAFVLAANAIGNSYLTDTPTNNNLTSYSITLQFPDSSSHTYNNGDTINLIHGNTYEITAINPTPTPMATGLQNYSQYYVGNIVGINDSSLSFSYNGTNEYIVANSINAGVQLRSYLFNVINTFNVIIS